MEKMYGGIEAGGTKFVCAVGSGPQDIRAETRFPTTTPEETLQRAVAFFQEQKSHASLLAVGIACFGPLDLNPESPGYGGITATPKPGWSNASVLKVVEQAMQIPTAIDTDVNVAALGEWRWGAAQGLDTFIYLTIGTGIGGGALVNGRPLHGLVHPEMGHIRVPHDWQADPFTGTCPFHGDCLEGLACGPAVEKRWGSRGETLQEGHPAWDLETGYIALALVNFICTLSPQRIVLGGGIMEQRHLFPLIHSKVQKLLNGYIQNPAILQDIQKYIVPPGLGSRSGVLGAIALAQSLT